MIYLDNLGTTQLDPRVRAAMDAVLDFGPGNPHAAHGFGWKAAEAVDEARRAIATMIGARASEIVFTSGATEANNLAIKGVASARGPGRIVVSAIEHPCVLNSAAALEPQGFERRIVGVDSEGRIDVAELEAALTDNTALVSVMLANNEIGTIEPLAEIAGLCRARGIAFHTDAVQAAGRMAIDVGALGVDLLSLSAHKFYGPLGIGILYARQGTKLQPILHGGAQQGGLRAGTVSAPLVVGMGAAARIAVEELPLQINHLAELTDSLYEHLRGAVRGLVLNGPAEGRLPGCLNVSVPGVDAEQWLLACPGLAASTGSACASGGMRPSHVLEAIGLSAELSAASVRLSVGRFTTHEDVEEAGRLLVEGVRQVVPDAVSVSA